jgi:ABC-2 type transport system ATP-binding protein
MMGEKDVVRLSGRFDAATIRRAFETLGDIDVVNADSAALLIALPGASRRLPSIFSAVASAGGEIQETSLSQPSLESLFIKLTGRQLRE